jgi:hypothetical protein
VPHGLFEKLVCRTGEAEDRQRRREGQQPCIEQAQLTHGIAARREDAHGCQMHGCMPEIDRIRPVAESDDRARIEETAEHARRADAVIRETGKPADDKEILAGQESGAEAFDRQQDSPSAQEINIPRTRAIQQNAEGEFSERAGECRKSAEALRLPPLAKLNVITTAMHPAAITRGRHPVSRAAPPSRLRCRNFHWRRSIPLIRRPPQRSAGVRSWR